MEMTISAVGRKDGFFPSFLSPGKICSNFGETSFFFILLPSRSGISLWTKFPNSHRLLRVECLGTQFHPILIPLYSRRGARPGMRILAIKKQGKIFVKENTHIIYSYILNI
ncbi:hypothetical protein T459_18714 [Capsicum annuum]|uniref:Uncharacterized protein n=2 Tax=Capsicum annuum TaxID=4072 RepID=A0A075VUN1_CAPAN|nr:hypothetical protein [Capsicum annuum]QFV19550.1 hypothetical protein [Capsicum annuum var. glabriusculum]AIG89884.1 hypothetical protein [Capsicum annuum]AIG90059.1 hypothetical protein [Capsicum annuum]PHT70180.1 hypothetical protein T459_25284 [Capsicum annuum]PHT75192.1 hypothetical protein T459_18714 [Capsicum annuum]